MSNSTMRSVELRLAAFAIRDSKSFCSPRLVRCFASADIRNASDLSFYMQNDARVMLRFGYENKVNQVADNVSALIEILQRETA